MNILKCIPVHSVTLKNILYIKNDPLIVPLKFCVEFLTYSNINLTNIYMIILFKYFVFNWYSTFLNVKITQFMNKWIK